MQHLLMKYLREEMMPFPNACAIFPAPMKPIFAVDKSIVWLIKKKLWTDFGRELSKKNKRLTDDEKDPVAITFTRWRNVWPIFEFRLKWKLRDAAFDEKGLGISTFN